MQMTDWLMHWTPRAIAVIGGGYYGLGIAYDLGLMALIDQVAIQLLKHFIGYAGVGALMPTVQWYSAWAARIGIGLGVGVLYDFLERGAKWLSSHLFQSSNSSACQKVHNISQG